MTNINPNLTKWLPAMKSWLIEASIDGIADRNRYIRYPSDWNKILKSIHFYNDIAKKVTNGGVNYGPATQLLNIDQIVDLCAFVEDISEGRSGVGFYSHVKYPLICDYQIAPTNWKLTVADKLENTLDKLKREVHVREIERHINGLRNETFTQERKKILQTMFVRYNDTQDRLRSNTKTWRELLPDLETAIGL